MKCQCGKKQVPEFDAKKDHICAKNELPGNVVLVQWQCLRCGSGWSETITARRATPPKEADK